MPSCATASAPISFASNPGCFIMTQTLPDTLHDPWLARSRETIARIDLAPQAETVGRVERVGDGIALVSGLPDACLSELLRFAGGRMGFALTLDTDSIGAVLLGSMTARRSRRDPRLPGPARSSGSRSDRGCSAASSIPSA